MPLKTESGNLEYQTFKEISEDATLGKALSLLNNSIDILIVLNKKKEYTGILQERQILRTDIDPGKSKVKTFRTSAPKVYKDTEIQECARLMIENNILYLPFFDKDKITGIVSYTDILRSEVLQKLSKLTIKEIMTSKINIANPEDRLAIVYNKFKKSDIFSLPVVDNGKYLGMVYLHDTLHTIIKHRDKPHFGIKTGEKFHLLDLPIKNIMTDSDLKLQDSATLGDVIDTIIKYQRDSISIIDSNNRLQAMITVKDLLKLVMTEENILLVPKIKIKADFDEVNRNSINIAITELVKKYSSILGQAEVEVFLKEHKERHRDNKLIYSRVQIHAHHNKYDATAEGWGVDHSLREVFEKLEKQIRRKKIIKKHNGKRIK